MTTETIVAVYDTPAHADLAIADLKQAGIPTSSIQHYTGEEYGFTGQDNAGYAEGAGLASTQPGKQTYDPASGPSGYASGTATTGTGERREGFWGWLLGEDQESRQGTAYEHHQAAYDQSLQRGGTVVTVIVEQQHVERVLSILEEHNPVDLDEHGGRGVTGTGTAASATGAAAAVAPSARPATAAPQPGTMASPPGTAATQAGMRNDNAPGAAGRTTEEVIPLSEESLQLGKREIDRGATRVRRYVVERPVEEQIRLRDEKVSVFRRPATNATVGADAFTDKTIDVRETAEEAVIGKTARVVEEVVVRKGVEERSQTVRETLRKEEVEINRPQAASGDDSLRDKNR